MIELSHVSFSYPDGENVLCDVSFSMGEEESVALLGENGSGKSTLLSLLTGLNTPTRGTVCLNGTALTKKHLPALRAHVGMVFQNPDDQLFMPTVYEDVAFGLRNRGLAPEAVDAAVGETLRQLGLAALADRPPYRLSGGEKRMAAIATVLAMGPKVLLFDEPTAYLDARSTRRFAALLPTIPGGKLLVTHDLRLAAALTGRALVLQKGRLLYDGSMEALLNDQPLLERAGL